jgi:hypothetical protein
MTGKLETFYMKQQEILHMAYDQIYFNKPFTVVAGKKTLDVACCDCGLVHEVSVKVLSKNRVQLFYNVNKRKTAACRRHWGIEGGASIEK